VSGSAWGRVAVVWRGDEEAERIGVASNERLRPMFEALQAVGLAPEPVVYRDDIAANVRERIAGVDGVLVWVDPVSTAGTRRQLDEILRDVATAGVWVSAHPDVIAQMGTKEVLFTTKAIGWSGDVARYESIDDLRARFPIQLGSGARVLKPKRGNGGFGVWKVERLDPSHSDQRDLGAVVRVHQALVRDLDTETVPLGEFLERCEPAFAHGGCMIDQPFQPRVTEGLIRVYMSAADLVGFGLQGAGPLLDEPGGAELVMGLPAPKTMFPLNHPPYQDLRRQVERWVPEMQRILDVPTDRLPVLWDADFLLGPPARDGGDTYVLCEINMSCITPFPPEAPQQVAAATAQHLRARHGEAGLS